MDIELINSGPGGCHKTVSVARVMLFSYIIPHLYWGGGRLFLPFVSLFSVNCCTGEGEGGGSRPLLLAPLRFAIYLKGVLAKEVQFFFFLFYLGSSAAALIGAERTGWRLCFCCRRVHSQA